MRWEKEGGEARGVGAVSPGQSYASYPQSHLISLELISNRLNTPGTVCSLNDHSKVSCFWVNRPFFYVLLFHFSQSLAANRWICNPLLLATALSIPSMVRRRHQTVKGAGGHVQTSTTVQDDRQMTREDTLQAGRGWTERTLYCRKSLRSVAFYCNYQIIQRSKKSSQPLKTSLQA